MGEIAAGKPGALDQLMERHYPRLYRIALGYLREPEDALDVVQEVFVKTLRHAGRLDAQVPVGPWLTRLTVNQSIDAYRRRRRRQQTITPLVDTDRQSEQASPELSPEHRALGGQIGTQISAALEGLPERQRAVFVLRHCEAMGVDEVARTLGMKVGTVKSSLHRTIRVLRTRLGGLLEVSG